jgi:ketosteroid isomerase-like protein
MVEFVKGLDYGIDLKYRSAAPSEEDTEQNRRNLLAALDRMVAGDNGALWELFDDTVVFHEAECLPYGGSHHGIEAARAAHATIYEWFDSIHIDLEQILAAGDLAIAYAWMTYRVRRNGRKGRFPLAEVYRFRGGKVIEWRVHYFDASTVAEALAAD